MDIEKYIKMSDEELFELAHLIPLDDIIKYKDKEYTLTPIFKETLTKYRHEYGYDFYYSGKTTSKQLQNNLQIL